MKSKKTIAAIAAVMLAVSSVSSLPFAVSANAEDIPAASEPANNETTDVPAENAGIAPLSEPAAVISAEEFADLTDEEKADYAQVTMEATPDMFVTYLKEGELTGTNIASGSYVKKGTDIYLCNPAENFHGSRFLVGNGDNAEQQFYTVYNGGDAWVATYNIQNTDNNLYISVSRGADYGVLTPSEYSALDAEMKPYYTQVNIQAPAYVWLDGEIGSGNYVLKNLSLWVAMLFDDYADYDIALNGEIVNAGSSGGSDNFGIVYVIKPDDDVINITAPATVCPKSTVSVEEGTGINVIYYVDGWTNGGYIYDGDQVRVGTPLLISCYKNLIAGYDILVNGEVLPLQLNGDSTHMINGYTPTSAETVITRVKRDELTEYERANYVPINFGSGIEVVEFPFSDGITIDEWWMSYESGDISEKGSEIRFVVDPENYAGKVLKINGVTYNMYINGDDTAYLLDYVIPNNSTGLNIELADAPVVVPSGPSSPSSSSEVSAPAPSTSAPSVSTKDAPTAKSVTSDLKKSSKSNISYNASEAGITEDILNAFAKNKYAKTMTAKFDNFKVKINKSDIEDAKALEGIDFSVSEKTFISKSQINKTGVLKNSKKIVQLNFESSEDISGLKKVNIQAKAGKSFGGSTAVVYELKGKKLVKVGTAKVDQNGYAAFNTDHLGQFVIAVK